MTEVTKRFRLVADCDAVEEHLPRSSQEIRLSKKRTALDFGKKLEIIQHHKVNPHLSLGKLSAVFGLNKSVVSGIIKDEEKILDVLNKSVGGEKRKRNRQGRFGLLEEKLMKWINEQLLSGLLIDGPKLKQQAKLIAEELKEDVFKASDGWLSSFKKRNGISFKPPSAAYQSNTTFQYSTVVQQEADDVMDDAVDDDQHDDDLLLSSVMANAQQSTIDEIGTPRVLVAPTDEEVRNALDVLQRYYLTQSIGKQCSAVLNRDL